MKFAILIPTLTERTQLKERVNNVLNAQINKLPNPSLVRIFTNEDQRQKATGIKRNELVADAIQAGFTHGAFMDDDDLPGATYIQRAIEFMESGLDCAELWGQIYFNGKAGNPFHHFINCINPLNGKIEWWQDNQFYYRMINHLNFVKLDLVKDIPFPDQVFGEDGKQSEAMRDAGIFKTMYPIPEVIYHYFVGEPKEEIK